MKRLILAVLPILLAAQIPLSVTKIVPSEWKKNFNFGVKWTHLLLDSYSSGLNDEIDSESIPEGVVTTTVILASMPEFEEQTEVAFDDAICQAQLEFAKRSREAIKIQKEMNRKYRVIQINAKTIQL